MPEDTSRANQLSDAFDRASEALHESGVKYALIGGFAVACHGLPRATQDVDFLISVPRLLLPDLLQSFQQRGFSVDQAVVLRELRDDHLSAIRYGDIRVDLLDAVLPVFRRAVERAGDHVIRGRTVRVVSPEDLIVLKLIASRPSDLDDVRGILAAKRDGLDVDSLRRSVAEVCDEARQLELERLLQGAG